MGNYLFAQNTAGKSDDFSRITLAAYVPQQIDQMPEAARSSLANKLSQIVTQNGLGGAANNERFIITANVNIISKEITSTAPPMHVYLLDITLYIGDGIEGTKFASISTTAKGIGENETKAYISALKNLKVTDSKYQTFIETGKTRIIEYYNSKCDFIIKEAQTLAKQNKFDEAISKLVSVPEICKACYEKCMDAIAPIYQQQIDRDCKLKLAEATNLWSANQTAEAANQIGEILLMVEPSASCFKEVENLSKKISTRLKEIDNREWDFKLKELDQASERIKAYRDIGVAFGKGQPKTVYNVRGWW
jgi:CRISPR/Cas system CMR-associated protein Cmr5 small subunit